MTASLDRGAMGPAADPALGRALDRALDRALGRAVRGPGFSARLAPRALLVASAALAVLLALAVASICFGDYPLRFDQVVDAIFGGSGGQSYIVQRFRLPRAVGGALAGALLGLSGAVFQTLARNVLASPDVLGVETGAALVTVILMTLGLTGTAALTGGAFAGAAVVTAAVYVLAYRRGINGMRLILVGIGVNACVTGGTSYVLMLAEVHTAERAHNWTLGGFNGLGWEQVAVLAAGLAVTLPLATGLAARLRTLSLGDGVARALGLPLERSRLLLVGTGVLAAAASVAVAGPVAFIALVAPQIARRLIGRPDGGLVTSAIFGALLAVAADFAGRQLAGDAEIPVGIVTALAGGPWLVYLLMKRGSRSTDG
ncbi:FecCD family ABC transporter permease [Microtetraspora malaysiensis]|uniref:FecCD family ABC transporter permease n=1 Tax=Microtetraspora malaysiensis TaxID=161358 RepID=UPI0009FFE800|nr:iron chelate uptake ABC transporter family permease subunit [Microtetraspora malaysiensis]